MSDPNYRSFTSQIRPARDSSDPLLSLHAIHSPGTVSTFGQKQDLPRLRTRLQTPRTFPSDPGYVADDSNRTTNPGALFQYNPTVDLNSSVGPSTSWSRAYSLSENDTNADSFGRYPPEVRDAPWDPFRATGFPLVNVAQENSQPRPSQLPSLNVQGQSRSSVDLRSQTNQTDEGYYTRSSQSQQETHSVYSAHTGAMTQRPHEVPNQGAYISVQQVAAAMAHPQVDQQTQSEPFTCEMENCNRKFKMQSELKKHDARHKREHVCQEPNCTRSLKGRFATINDLDRHRKTVHNVPGLGRDYKCFAKRCAKHNREWPRLDNFKQHLKRMHPLEDTEALVKRSDEWFDTEKNPGPTILRESSYTPSGPSPSQSGLNPQQANAGAANLSPRNSFSLSHKDGPSTSANVSAVGVSTTSLANGAAFWDRSSTGIPAPSHAYLPSQGALSAVMRQEPPMNPNTDTVSVSSSASVAHKRPSHFSPSAVGPHYGRFGTRTAHEPSVPSIDASIDELSEMCMSQTYQSHGFPIQSSEVDLAQIHANPANNPPNDDSIGESSGQPGLGASPFPSPMPAKLPDEKVKSLSRTIETFLRDHIKQNATARLEISDSQIDQMSRTLLESLHNSSSTDESSCDSANSRSEGSTAITSTNEDGKTHYLCPEPDCTKSMQRQCDLRKHIKRHAKPYGCTFDKCYKVFGSKDDWKRHESTQHLQEECFRCQEPKSQGSGSRPANGRRATCCKLFYRRDSYVNHLKEDHKVTDDDLVRDRMKQGKIGRDSKVQYWCGFCRRILSLTKIGVEAIDERYNHIDRHFMKDHKSIDAWMPPDSEVSKGETRAKMVESSDGHVSAESNEEELDPLDDSVLSAGPTSAPGAAAPKRTAESASEPGVSQKKQRREIFCKECGMGPISLRLNSHCPLCGENLLVDF